MPNRLSKEEFILRIIKIHSSKYDYSKVEYTGLRGKIKIICNDKKHGHYEFNQKAQTHLLGSGCPKCSKKYKRTLEDLIQDFRKVHGDKYNYDKVKLKRVDKLVIMTCHEHGDFKQCPRNHINGGGCLKCSSKLRKSNISEEEFTLRANLKYSNKYDYSESGYKNTKKKIKIKCLIEGHGFFYTTPNAHLNGTECRVCNNSFSSKEQFIHFSKKMHGEKYDYSKVVYVYLHVKVIIKCNNCNNEFLITPKNHVKIGVGCNKCKERSKRSIKSNGEYIIVKFLELHKINYIKEKIFENCKKRYHLKFDFYLPEFNLCIEYDGKQHFKDIKFFGGEKTFNRIKENDIIKNDFCEKNNIRMFRIKYTDIKKINEILTKLIIN